jgi:hypothetical protein
LAIVVLLILAALWAALLVPPYLRSRSEQRPADSIGDFRNKLRVLERTGPASVRPANRLWGPATPIPPYQPSRSSGLATLGQTTRRVPTRAYGSDQHRRRAAQRRRRDIFLTLLGLTVLSGVCAMVPGLSAMWYLAGAMFVALGAYTALLVHMRNVTAEREMKLRFLPSGSSNEAAPAPAYAMRRSAN